MSITELKEQLIKLENKGFGNEKAILNVNDKFGNSLEAEFVLDKNSNNLSNICNHKSLLGFMFNLSCKDNYYGEDTRVNIRHIKKYK